MAKRPLAHLPLVAAVSAAGYAATLAWVTAVQADADQALAAARAPLARDVASAQDARRRTQAAVDAAVRELRHALRGYQLTVDASGTLDRRLEELGALVADVTGAASSLPQNVPLPAAPTTVQRVVVLPAPATQGTTGASGG